MTDASPVNPRNLLTAPKAKPLPINTRQLAPVLAPPSATFPSSPSGVRSGHLNLDTFSPVNQDGSFAFDRVLRSGEVHKRTRKTKVFTPSHSNTRISLTHLLAAMEILLPCPPSQPSFPLQISHRGASAQTDPSQRSQHRRLLERPKRSPAISLRPLLSRAQLSLPSQERRRCQGMGRVDQA